jgi:heme A synthase
VTRHKALFYAGGVAFFITGISGAIAALGDTLFPSATFLEGARLDLEPSAHLFLRLRAIHPFTAVGSALLLLFIAGQVMREGNQAAATAGKALGMLVLLQVLVGLVNLLLAAPAALQLLHLLVGDGAWISFVVMVVAAAWGPLPTAHSTLPKASPAHS